MARIKINDIPKDLKISKEEMKKVFGGIGTNYNTTWVMATDRETGRTVDIPYLTNTVWDNSAELTSGITFGDEASGSQYFKS